VSRRAGNRYTVHTVSLNDLLEQHGAPGKIDYLSVDTEGSELRILSAFDFEKYSVDVINVEHNFTVDREAIHALLVSKGFVRKFEMLSLFDDWYVRRTEA
jgi:Methyltransferase FkbM domain